MKLLIACSARAQHYAPSTQSVTAGSGEIELAHFGLTRRQRLMQTFPPSLLIAALVGALFLTGGATPAAGDETEAEPRVGHTVERMIVRGSAERERSNVAVHLWYPADPQRFSSLPQSEYSSALYGLDLVADHWDPLSWTADAGIAREGAAIDPGGRPFPVIVFSHGSTNNPIDYAYTLESIAGAGFVVAAPSHVNNTQDDVRIDFINTEAAKLTPPRRVFDCNDGRPSPCARLNVPFSMADRVSDIANVLDELPGWLGRRVDTARAGVLGHSRGTVSALAAAGGSADWHPDATCQAGAERCWPLAPEHADGLGRLKAVMGLAIAIEPITRGANLANVDVPTLLVAGKLDRTSLPAISESAFQQVESTDKAYVEISSATHRHFDSTYCDQTQAAGAIAQVEPRAILDFHTIRGTVRPTTSGQAIDYCPFSTFTMPVDIRPLVASLIGFTVTPDNVPTTGLDTDEVEQRVTELAVGFFGRVLGRSR